MNLKTPTEAPRADSNPTTSTTKQVKKVVSIALYYIEVVVGKKVKTPIKNYKNKQIMIVASAKLAVASDELLIASLKQIVARSE